MLLHKVSGHWQADAASPARWHQKGGKETSRGQVVCLSALARGAGPHVFRNGRWNARPPHGAPSEEARLVPAKVPAEQRWVELVRHSLT